MSSGPSPSRVIVAANRGPYRTAVSGGRRRWVRSAGGLVTALDPVLRARGGVWVSAQEGNDHHSVSLEDLQLEYDLAPVAISRTHQEGFYQGVSNALLWPLLHSFPPTIRIGIAPWRHYVAANEAFAKVVLEHHQDGDLVWVQDYHLLLVPNLLREAHITGPVGWFCHVPWPSSDLFSILPWRAEILEGLLGADVLGFHTPHYVNNFLECVHRLTPFGVDYEACEIDVGSRKVRVVSAPIGIPVDEVQTLAADPVVLAEANRIRQSVGNRKIILGVDRLDYTKGIVERIVGYEQFLRAERSARDRYVFIQVMVPSRTGVRAYAELKSEVDRLVGDVNGRYSATGQVPIHYRYRNLDQRALYAHYRAADVALVTPLRDGMNLVAHEYVASRLDCTGALILSEFAGASEYLHDALLVNPYDIGAITESLRLAFRIPPSELRRRMQSLRAEVHKLDVHLWAKNYLELVEQRPRAAGSERERQLSAHPT